MSKTADVRKIKKMSIRLFLIQKIVTTFARMWFFIENQNIFNLHKTCFFFRKETQLLIRNCAELFHSTKNCSLYAHYDTYRISTILQSYSNFSEYIVKSLNTTFEFTKLRAFRAYVPQTTTCLHAYVPSFFTWLRAHVFTCLCMFLVPTCPCALNYYVTT